MMQADDRKHTLMPTILCAVAFGVFSAACRLLPYYFPAVSATFWNLAPMGALSIFVGSRLRGHYAYLVPLAALVASDLLLIPHVAGEGYSAFGWGRLPIYACFVLYVLIGRLVPAGEMSLLTPVKVGGAAVAGNLQFFLITNFLVWLNGTTYEHTREGLMACYAMAIPFYRNTLMSDVVCAAGFFLIHAVMVRGIARVKAGQPA